jgi:hypothetical protein
MSPLKAQYLAHLRDAQPECFAELEACPAVKINADGTGEIGDRSPAYLALLERTE